MALLLTAGLFAYWLGLGYAAIASGTSRPGLRELLLSPAVGMSVNVLPICILNRAGVPVADLGLPVGAGLVLVAAIVLGRRRLLPRPRDLGSVGGVVLVALFLTGSPMLRCGFDWISYCNEDMTNISYAAHRVLDHGFFDVPDHDDLVHGREYSQYYWFVHVLFQTRPGMDFLLAWIASATGYIVPQIYMPTIVACHLALVCAAGALVCTTPGRRAAALWTCLLVATSALTTFGTVSQLLNQTAGLALLAASASLLMRSWKDLNRKQAAHHGAVVGLVFSALILVYPEIVPFLVFSWLAWVAVSWPARPYALKPAATVIAVGAGTVVVLLNRHLLGPLAYLFHQVTVPALAGVFPYYLLPSGLACLWGLLPVSAPLPPEPIASGVIVASGLLLAVAVLGACWRARHADPPSVVVAVMAGVAVWLSAHAHGFGLYKLAMYVQPFLAGSIVLCCFELTTRRFWRLALLLSATTVGLRVQAYYVDASWTAAVTTYPEIPGASSRRLTSQLLGLSAVPPGSRLVSDSSIPPLAKLQALCARAVTFATPGVPPYGYLFELMPSRWCDPHSEVAGRALSASLSAQSPQVRFDLHDQDAPVPSSSNTFRINGIGFPAGPDEAVDYLVRSSPGLTIVNRWTSHAPKARMMELQPWATVSNHLVFQSSWLGALYSDFLLIPTCPGGLYKLEPDTMYPGRSMAGIGRHLLFSVLKPTDRCRILVDLTTTLLAERNVRLPPAAAIGSQRRYFSLVGRGAARVWSPILTPQTIAGRSFVALDMGRDGERFPEERTGAMTLWGAKYRHDNRPLVGFARAIALVSEDEYAALQPPCQLSRFPEDLRIRDLEFSGFFEDGWIADEAYCRLGWPDQDGDFCVRGVVPLIADAGFWTELSVLLDGHEIARKRLGLGDFEIVVATTGRGGIGRVEVKFSRQQPLPRGDGRPVAARLAFLGFRVNDEATRSPK